MRLRDAPIAEAGLLAAALAAGVRGCGSTGPSSSTTHPLVATVRPVGVPGAAYGVAISGAGRTLVTVLNAAEVVADPALPIDGFGTPLAVGLAPPHVVFSPDGSRAYVTNQTGQSLSASDVAGDSVLGTVPLPADGFNLITSRDGGTVSEVDVATHAVRRTFPTGGMPPRLAVSPRGDELLIANETLGLDIWSLSAGTRDTALAMAAYGLGLSPDGEKVYVAAGPPGTITIVDPVARTVDTVLSVGGTTLNVAFTKAGDAAVVTNEAGFVTVIE